MKKRDAARSAQQTAPIEERAQWRQWIPVALILLAAVALRVIYLMQYKAQVPFFSFPIVDSEVYDKWAQRVVAGQGYGAKPFYTAPLYPYLLALVYKIAGHKLMLVYAGQAFLGVLNLFFVYILGRRIFGHRTGLVAMCLLTLYAPLAYLETKLLTETLSVTLSLASILLLMRVVDRPTPAKLLAIGVLMGISAVLRANVLITVALIVVWLLIVERDRIPLGRRLTLRVLPLLIGVVLAILPVTVRNYVVGKDLALLSTNGGIVFAQANNKSGNGISLPLPGFTGSLQTQQDEEMAVASRELGHEVKPSESASYWFGEGVRFIREDPGGFAWLTLRKMIWSLHNGESSCIYNVYLEKQMVPVLRLLFLPFSLLAAFGLYGIVRSTWRTGSSDARLLALTVLSVFLSLVLFSVSSRYRAPAAPPLAIFAGYGLLGVTDLIRSRNPRGLGIAAAWIVPVFLVSLVPYPRAYITVDGPTNVGAVYFLQGRNNEAIAELEKALALAPGYASANLYMGRALAQNGDFAGAVPYYERVFEMQPDNVDAHYYLAFALANVGRPNEAEYQYRETIRLAPKFAEVHFNLAILVGNLGRLDEAISEYRKAIELGPDFTDARFNLAVCLYIAKRYAEAWDEVHACRRYGREFQPDFIRALSGKMPEPGR